MPHETAIHVLFIENKHALSDKEWERLIHPLPTSIQQQIIRFKRWQDRQATLFGKLLLQKGLLSIQEDPQLIQTIRLDTYKRPLLSGDVDFNISHTDGLVGCAIQRSSRLGIDIERIRPIDLIDFKSVFTPAEISLISNNADPRTAFFDCWTRKEAVMKADGRGFHLDPKTFEVINDRIQINVNNWYVKKVPVSPGYCCHLALASDQPVIRHHLALEELFI